MLQCMGQFRSFRSTSATRDVSLTDNPAVQHSATERSLSPVLALGTLFRIQCHLLAHSLLSDDF